MLTEWTEEMYERLHAEVTEAIRLHSLTDLALVREAVQRGLVDDLLIDEMATRLDPEWAYRNEGEI